MKKYRAENISYCTINRKKLNNFHKVHGMIHKIFFDFSNLCTLLNYCNLYISVV